MTDPYSLGADDATRARSRAGRPRRPRRWRRAAGTACASRRSTSPRTRRSTSCTCATSRSPTRPCPAAHRGTYLRVHATRDSDGMRHLRRLAGSRHEHAAPAADQRHRDDRGGPLARSRSRRATSPSFPPDSRAAAGVRRPGRATRTASTGATTRCTTRRPRAPTRPTRTAPRARASSARWSQGINGAGLRVVMDVVYNHTPAAGQDPKSILDRIVPGYYHRLNPATGAVETSTCCSNTATEHRDDGEADGRLGRDLGTRVQGRRLPLRPHGPPLEGQHAQRAPGARPLTLGARRGRRQARSTSTARAGTSARSPNNARFVQATPAQHGRHRDRHVQRPAARRRPRRRPVRRGPAHPGLRQRPVHRPERRRGQRHAGAAARAAAAATRTRSRSGWPATCATTGSSTAPARPSPARRSTTTASPPATPPSRTRRSPTSTRTTTRRCSTRCSTSCRTATVDGRPGADEHGRAVDRRARRRARRSGTPAPTSCAPSRWTATATTPATGSTGSTGRATESTWGSGLPPRDGQRGQVGLHAAAAGRPGARAVAGRHPRRPRPRRRAAADPLLVAAVPARQRARDPAARELPDRRAGPDARRDRDGDRRPPRRHRGGLQRDAGRRPRRPSPCAAVTRCTRCRPGAATRWCGRRRTGPTGRSRCRAGRPLCSLRARRGAGRANCGWVGSGDAAGAAGLERPPRSVVDFYNGSRGTGRRACGTAADSAGEGLRADWHGSR